jgi:SAM-dependent methyltransferase
MQERGSMASSDTDIQRQYYTRTADMYDQWHGEADDPHSLPMALAGGLCQRYGYRSVLDVGAGTGRLLRYLGEAMPSLHLVGIEPVEALRKKGHESGVAADRLVDGDATRLPYADGSFDLVCAFAILHHIRRPQQAVAELLRVARAAVLISDSNRFGQGNRLERRIKRALAALGLWRAFDWVQTRGKGYRVSESDGLFYSYSLFDNYQQIRAGCRKLHVFNTAGGGRHALLEAGSVAILGLK